MEWNFWQGSLGDQDSEKYSGLVITYNVKGQVFLEYLRDQEWITRKTQQRWPIFPRPWRGARIAHDHGVRHHQ